jgi:phosphoenolpyruvate carboxykinase (ATP)
VGQFPEFFWVHLSRPRFVWFAGDKSCLSGQTTEVNAGDPLESSGQTVVSAICHIHSFIYRGETIMQNIGMHNSSYGLEKHGILNTGNVYWNLPTPVLYEHAVRREEGIIAHEGPLVVSTAPHTGRSPKDKFIVREPSSQDKIWWGDVNPPFEPERFDRYHARIAAYLQRKDLFVQDCFVGAESGYRIPLRVITDSAWQNIAARNMFLRATDEEISDFVPEFTVIAAPSYHANPEIDGTRSEVGVIINLAKRLVLIGGSSYGGEIKKSVFTVLNYVYPQRGALSMHCSANKGDDGDVAIFFGLSGTGKTSLSADVSRQLIGDDEHGWSENGVFNFEGGCYAKVIRLSPEAEPEIYQTTRSFGTILENVVIDPVSRLADLDNDTITENTRASYPLTQIPNYVASGTGDHPKNVIMLTADAFGVMPPIAKLTPAQAMYHFLSGYTAKLAGTEKGVMEPQATFSTCFGAPFMILHPTVYADMLGEKIAKHNAQCWLVNTGWTGGPFGVGHRMQIAYTRAMVDAVLSGTMEKVSFTPDPVFGVFVPDLCPGDRVPNEVLKPKNTWQDPAAYDVQAKKLAHMFNENFKQFESMASEEVRAAGPKEG